MFSRFKTLKELLAAKGLTGDDALAQRAVIVIRQTLELQGRAYEMGHAGAYEDSHAVIAYAALALGALDKAHRYAFLDVNELNVDVRATYEMNVARGTKVEASNADELVTHAELGFESIDALVPMPSVRMTMHGKPYLFVLRGSHCLELLAHLAPAANSNTAGLRPV